MFNRRPSGSVLRTDNEQLGWKPGDPVGSNGLNSGEGGVGAGGEERSESGCVLKI